MLKNVYLFILQIIQETCTNKCHSFVTLVFKRSIECLLNASTGHSSKISLNLETRHSLKVEEVPFKTAFLSLYKFLKVLGHPKKLHD